MPNLLRPRRRSLSLTSAVLALSAISASMIVLFACGSSDSGGVPAATPDGGGTPGDADSGGPGPGLDSGGQSDTSVPSDAATNDASDSGGDAALPDGGVTLTVQNYLSWCTVAVNGGGTSTAATQTLTVAPGTVVNLSGDLSSSTFVWGYWYGTAGDTTAAHDTSKMTTVTVNANKTVQACCPFAVAPNTPCPAPM